MAATTRNAIAAGKPPESVSVGHRFNTGEKEALRSLAESDRPADQRRALEYLRLASDSNRRFILEIADKLIPRRSHHVRWQTLLLLGQFCETHPDDLWPLVVKWGSVESEDIRAGVACCILEHILEYHFQPYFQQSVDLIAGGNRRFQLTLQACWKLGQAAKPDNAAAFDAFLASLVRR